MKRQQRKLNFLITQTELYAHFMARKLTGSTDAERDAILQHFDEPALLKPQPVISGVVCTLPDDNYSMLMSLLNSGSGVVYCDQPIYLCVCLSQSVYTSISLEPPNRSSRNFVGRSSVAVAQSSSTGVALRYVLPVYG